jgi:hypothetical protein
MFKNDSKQLQNKNVIFWHADFSVRKLRVDEHFQLPAVSTYEASSIHLAMAAVCEQYSEEYTFATIWEYRSNSTQEDK